MSRGRRKKARRLRQRERRARDDAGALDLTEGLAICDLLNHCREVCERAGGEAAAAVFLEHAIERR